MPSSLWCCSVKTSKPDPAYTDAEADEARLWVGRYGPSNSWTASFGTAARMIGRLLQERDRLIQENQALRRDAFDSGNAPTTIQ